MRQDIKVGYDGHKEHKGYKGCEGYKRRGMAGTKGMYAGDEGCNDTVQMVQRVQ